MAQQSNVKDFSLGLQHVLAMYAGAVIVPLIVGNAIGLTPAQLTYLISIDIMMCGIATILQVWKNKFSGIGLPVVLGCTFTAVGPIINIANTYSIQSVYGSILVSGLIVVLIASFFSKLIRFFPPVVTGSVVTTIGLTLIPVAINDLAGGQGAEDFGSAVNLFLGFITLIIILLILKFAKGFFGSIAILSGIILGTVIGAFFGRVDLTPVAEASWLHLPQVFYFGTPEFHLLPILTMTLVALVSLVESTGVYFALGDITEKKINGHDLKRGYRAEGMAIILGGLVNAFPYTTFSQNVGLIQISGVRRNKIIYIAGVMLIILGLAPKIGAATLAIPGSVLGGAMLAMFGMVISAGIKMLSHVDLNKQENMVIVAISLGMGLAVTVVPDLFAVLPENLSVITSSGIVMGSLTAIVLNAVFNFKSIINPRNT
ncbi:Uric acid permease PucK [Jeotgalicoccus aerolatus]|uniref:Xanthine permease n=1 Tax=Jeotgalicoccus aerolatus TaxID=709510 RepID=A0A1G8YU86_9STAP|nr:nucleobase:cation symporter-2 family protein [Jeotgalicoccus aerolatus]MBP1952889.1 xanthine permease [Jeotgalicoccus aerolatus]NMA80588.1 purine permease [Jeotgalicoccus aerolatus]CAD2080322.1 Uric acid permease PucK [Jeotgalicoccus aerolatus]SDK06343.1 xanthine permease [Jeotgalicoccus aerolatus]GGE07207.1 xanthine permease [Jeotgalicoccus aerolatus]